MNRHAYLLVLLLVWAQVDDCCAAAAVLPSALLAEDDEYLPPQRRPQQEERSAHDKPLLLGLKPQTADFSVVRGGVPSGWNLIAPFTPAPIHVFMSLQI
jgi:hypothetical protein